jgi:hypothetical protein
MSLMKGFAVFVRESHVPGSEHFDTPLQRSSHYIVATYKICVLTWSLEPLGSTTSLKTSVGASNKSPTRYDLCYGVHQMISKQLKAVHASIMSGTSR